MEEIFLNFGELQGYAANIKNLVGQMQDIQNEIKSSVNQLDSDGTGRYIEDITDEMYSSFNEGQKLTAGITEIQTMISDVINIFTELDGILINNVDTAYSNAKNSKTFWKEYTDVEKEINSDFKEMDNNALRIEKETFMREVPKLPFDRIEEFFQNPKMQAIITLMGGGVLLFSRSKAAPASALGVGVLAHGASDLYEHTKENGYNPLQNTHISGIIKNAKGLVQKGVTIKGLRNLSKSSAEYYFNHTLGDIGFDEGAHVFKPTLAESNDTYIYTDNKSSNEITNAISFSKKYMNLADDELKEDLFKILGGNLNNNEY